VNDEFKQAILNLSDEAEIDEIEAARILLEAESDTTQLSRSLLECGIIRVHQHRRFTLDIVRLLIELDRDRRDELDDERQPGNEDGREDIESDNSAIEWAHALLAEAVWARGPERVVPRCLQSMRDIKGWIQKLADKITRASVLATGPPPELETIEFSRKSLVQQHELLGIILCRAVEAREANEDEFKGFLKELESADRYDNLLVHKIPALGALLTHFGSMEGGRSIQQARSLHAVVCAPEPSTWPLQFLQAAVRAWWLIEYGCFYLEDVPHGVVSGPVDFDEEDRQRTKQFSTALSDGAFDFILSLAADVKAEEWQDPARMGMRSWLQRRSPGLPSDLVPFSEAFQKTLMRRLEVFIDGFISNLPDVLRRLRVEEDEQRQLSQTHEHDLNLERFLLIIAYAYEGRSDAANNWWAEEGSNLSGFLHWASRRASTPLVTAFCELLQAISPTQQLATAAHEFLLDDTHHSSGKMKKSLTLKWTQIFKELEFFYGKIREKPTPTPTTYRPGKPPSTAVSEAEPESAMMLECYLRLITKLATESEAARSYLLAESGFNLLDLLFRLASSQIPPRLRACAFWALDALLTQKSTAFSHDMWINIDTWAAGGYSYRESVQSPPHTKPPHAHFTPLIPPERVLEEISGGFEEPYALSRLLTTLVTLPDEASVLHDSLPFPEALGSSYRQPGIDLFVDYVLGQVFSRKANDLADKHQLRMLRLQCLQFAQACLASFNENLILLGNTTSLNLDAAIAATDLATYVRLHPCGRVMEWFLSEKAVASLIATIHQDKSEVGNADPDSPLILSIHAAVMLILTVLDLQPTYLDLVRPLVRQQRAYRKIGDGTSTFPSFEDALVSHMSLVVDVGMFAGIGHVDLALACLKLLERMSSSPRIVTAWSSPTSGPRTHRNKAVVALEANSDHKHIAGQLIGDLATPLPVLDATSPQYLIKLYILDFFLSCLKESPKKPSIAHLLLGFQCQADRLEVEPNGTFFAGTSMFHEIVKVWNDTPLGDESGVRTRLVTLKSKVLQILRIMWNSPLTAQHMVNELRDIDFVFALLLNDMVMDAALWEGEELLNPQFLLTDGFAALGDFLAHRAAVFDYISMELCNVSQHRLPTYKRKILEALCGNIAVAAQDSVSVPSIFEMFDFLFPTQAWAAPEPEIDYFRGLDLNVCMDRDSDQHEIFNIERVKEILLLKRSVDKAQLAVATQQQLAVIEREEMEILEFALLWNRRVQLETQSHKLLKAWVGLMLIMLEANDTTGNARTAFFLQALQTILPALERCSADNQVFAYELAKLAKVILFKLDLSPVEGSNGASTKGLPLTEMSHLVGDKLFQLFQICLQAIGKWAEKPELRAVYYSICYRYLTGASDPDGKVMSPLGGRQKTMKTIAVYGDRLANVICDDAYGGETGCQTAALILLSALVHLGSQEGDGYVIEMLNRLNFIGVLVDSLRNVMVESIDITNSGSMELRHYQDAKLALLQQLCRTREGAKFVLHANLLKAVETSRLFSVDPELQIGTVPPPPNLVAPSIFDLVFVFHTDTVHVRTDAQQPKALETHYALLAKVARIIGAAILSRAEHNLPQGRRFLRDHRDLVTHTLKRSAGIGPVEGGLRERIEDLGDAFVMMITATGFLEVRVSLSLSLLQMKLTGDS
jgi:nuclear pore complex protein Nup205